MVWLPFQSRVDGVGERVVATPKVDLFYLVLSYGTAVIGHACISLSSP